MSSHTLRRAAVAALASSALVGGLTVGVAAPSALAQPSDSSSSTEETRRPVSPDAILMMISDEYQTGRGGGQVSKLIEQVITLRMRGIRPSPMNTEALAAALDKRPNQKPLIDALNETLNFQRRQMAQGSNQIPSGSGAPPVATPGSAGAPAWSPGNPMQRDSDEVFQMPGR